MRAPEEADEEAGGGGVEAPGEARQLSIVRDLVQVVAQKLHVQPRQHPRLRACVRLRSGSGVVKRYNKGFLRGNKTSGPAAAARPIVPDEFVADHPWIHSLPHLSGALFMCMSTKPSDHKLNST